MLQLQGHVQCSATHMHEQRALRYEKLVQTLVERVALFIVTYATGGGSQALVIRGRKSLTNSRE